MLSVYVSVRCSVRVRTSRRNVHASCQRQKAPIIALVGDQCQPSQGPRGCKYFIVEKTVVQPSFVHMWCRLLVPADVFQWHGHGLFLPEAAETDGYGLLAA